MTVRGTVIKNSIKIGNKITHFNLDKPLQQQRKTLRKLCFKARNTDFGRFYNFDEIIKAILFKEDHTYFEEFKSQVPIFDYTSLYEQWWHKVYNGQKNVCWPGKVSHFALSSGTSGAASKRIPVTKAMIKAIKKSTIQQLLTLRDFKNLDATIFEKSYLMIGGSTMLNKVGDHHEGDLSGITQKNIPFWFHRFYKPGEKIAKEKDWEKKLDELTQNAKNWDIAFLAGVPAWIQLLLERIVKTYELDHIHQIWPNLTAYAWGGVAIEPYKRDFQKLLGKEICYIETYLASEGFLAYQKRLNGGLALVLNNGIFFEFIPFNDENFDQDGNVKNGAKTLLIKEVNLNETYALLISTCSGAWRYLIGDVIQFTDLEKAEIKISGRTKHFISLCGEHLSVDNMNMAIAKAAEHFGICIKEYCVCGEVKSPYFAHRWYLACDNPSASPQAIGQFIDDELKILNDDYAIERQHALKHLYIELLPTHTFYSWMQKNGKIGGQTKFPKVLKGEQLNDWQNFLKASQEAQMPI